MSTRILLAAVAAITLSVGVIAVAPAPAAHAAGGSIEISTDGVTFVSNLSGSLFTDIATMVPGDSQSANFYVRNSGNQAGFLRITLRDVVSTDAHLASALTVSASVPGFVGAPVAVDTATPCRVLTEGLVLAPGQTATVATSAALGDLLGQNGQGGNADFAIRVALSDATPGSLPPTDCGPNDITTPDPTVPGITVPGTPGGGTGGGQGTGGAVQPDEDDTAAIVPEVDTELPVLPFPELLGIDPNTWRLYQELLVFVLFGALIVGAGTFWIVAARRRRRDEEENDEEIEVGA